MPRQMERFTTQARALVAQSHELAVRFNCAQIMPVHLLLAMTQANQTDAFIVLDDHDIIADKLIPFLKARQCPYQTKSADIYPSSEMKSALEQSIVVARERNHFYIAPVHVLIGVLRAESGGIDAIMTHFDAQRKHLIKYAQFYLDEHAKFERNPDEQEIPPLHVTTSPDEPTLIQSILGLFQRTRKRKNSEK